MNDSIIIQENVKEIGKSNILFGRSMHEDQYGVSFQRLKRRYGDNMVHMYDRETIVSNSLVSSRLFE